MITREELNQVRQKAVAIRAMVIGDVMLDQYIFGAVNRISPEAPVPVVNLQRTDMKAGGAANVAVNLAAWGCQTALIGLVGKDKDAERLTDLMKEKSIQPFWIESSSRPTTVKTRVVAATHHLLRIDQESADYLQGEEEKIALQKIEQTLQEFKPDLIILEDYNKGLLTDRIISSILKYGRDHKVFL
ncbi:MAG TPA: PfkB family carbohydrate kinase, partial [Saprospiraceae bacterium]|nr:PfkB family carbohydrate kinase [Saprospiraceae bacterium]